jgi:hypothetical protein
MSAEEKMALARRLMEARVEGDLDALDEMLAPDFVSHTKYCPLQPQYTLRGPDSGGREGGDQHGLINPLALVARLGSQPQGDVGGQHSLPYHPYQVVAQRVQVCLVS